jgi:hypothetical protein
VVDDGEAEYEIGTNPVDERHAFARSPAESRRRIGKVHDEREDPALPLSTEIAVQTIDDEVVAIHGNHGSCAPRQCQSAEVAVVGTEVEHLSDGAGSDDPRHEELLGVEVGGAVVRPVRVVRPRGCLAPPREPGDGLLEALELRVDDRWPESRALQFGLDIALTIGVGVPLLGSRVQLHVHQHVLVEQGITAQEMGGHMRRDAVDAASQKGLERDIA